MLCFKQRDTGPIHNISNLIKLMNMKKKDKFYRHKQKSVKTILVTCCRAGVCSYRFEIWTVRSSTLFAALWLNFDPFLLTI